MLSKKLPGIRVVAVELEVGGEAAAKGAQALQQFGVIGSLRYGGCPGVSDVNLDLVARLEGKRLDDSGGEPNGEAVPPFCDQHPRLLGYTIQYMYIVADHDQGTLSDSIYQCDRLPSRA